MGAPCAHICQTACAPVAAHVCTTERDEGHEAASGPSAAQSCTKDDSTEPMAAPGPSRTCASREATRLGACSVCWRVETTDLSWTGCHPLAPKHRDREGVGCTLCFLMPARRVASRRVASRRVAPQPQPFQIYRSFRQPNLAAPARSVPWASPRAGAAIPGFLRSRPAACRRSADHKGLSLSLSREPLRTVTRSFPRATTSHERPAEWSPTMHRCARAPALPWAPIGLIGAQACSAGTRRCLVLPSRRLVSTRVQRRARTQLDSRVHTGPPWSVWPGKSSRAVQCTKPG
jgi:hypothetical protein